MLYHCLAVGVGGALGAMGRYCLSLLPILQRSPFPLATLLINVTGSILIGLVAESCLRWPHASPTLLLFLRVGVCGGFTTFSTFSLESLVLLEDGRPVLFSLYVLLNVTLCLAGVWLGKTLIRQLV